MASSWEVLIGQHTWYKPQWNISISIGSGLNKIFDMYTFINFSFMSITDDRKPQWQMIGNQLADDIREPQWVKTASQWQIKENSSITDERKPVSDRWRTSQWQMIGNKSMTDSGEPVNDRWLGVSQWQMIGTSQWQMVENQSMTDDLESVNDRWRTSQWQMIGNQLMTDGEPVNDRYWISQWQMIEKINYTLWRTSIIMRYDRESINDRWWRTN